MRWVRCAHRFSVGRGRGNFAEAERLASQAVAINPQGREAGALLRQLQGMRQRLPGLR